VPAEQRNRVAQFLESQGLRDEALAVSTDPDQRFDLGTLELVRSRIDIDNYIAIVAVALQQLGTAHEIAKQVDAEQKWRQLADLALRQQEFDLSRECMQRSDDFAGLLLLATSLGMLLLFDFTRLIWIRF
jgi:coatomer subunit beta'